MFEKNSQFFAIATLLALIAIPPFVQARGVDSVVIEENSLSMEPDPISIKKCKSFTVTAEQVTRYFNNAYPVEADFAARDRYTPCYAKGNVKFSDNFYGEWLLFSSGTASFNFRRGDFVTFYYKNNEWYDPTNGEYSPREEKEY